jgi:hypothetical protein
MTRSARDGRLLAVAVVLCGAALALAACTLALSVPSTAPPTGHVSGTVLARGGPMAPGTRRPNSPWPVQAKVTAVRLGAGHSPSYSVATTSDGSFRLDLPPGTYELAGTLTGPNDGDRISPDEVSVTAGETTTVELFVNYP